MQADLRPRKQKVVISFRIYVCITLARSCDFYLKISVLLFEYASRCLLSGSVADPDPGFCLFDPGSGMNNEHPGSYFREFRN